MKYAKLFYKHFGFEFNLVMLAIACATLSKSIFNVHYVERVEDLTANDYFAALLGFLYGMCILIFVFRITFRTLRGIYKIIRFFFTKKPAGYKTLNLSTHRLKRKIRRQNEREAKKLLRRSNNEERH